MSFFPSKFFGRWWPSPASCWVPAHSACHVYLPAEFLQVTLFRGVGFFALASALIFVAAISYQHVMVQRTDTCHISGDWSSWSSCHLELDLVWIFFILMLTGHGVINNYSGHLWDGGRFSGPWFFFSLFWIDLALYLKRDSLHSHQLGRFPDGVRVMHIHLF